MTLAVRKGDAILAADRTKVVAYFNFSHDYPGEGSMLVLPYFFVPTSWAWDGDSYAEPARGELHFTRVEAVYPAMRVWVMTQGEVEYLVLKPREFRLA